MQHILPDVCKFTLKGFGFMKTKTYNMINSVEEYFVNNPDFRKKSYEELAGDILEAIYIGIDLHNAACEKYERWSKPQELPVSAIVTALQHMREIRALDLCSISEQTKMAKENAVLAIYDPKCGLYEISTRDLQYAALALEPALTTVQQRTILDNLLACAPLTRVTRDPNLIPVGNGVFDREAKMLRPFSPEYVFLSKSNVNYVPFPANPVIHNDNDGTDWDIESWMASLSDDKDIVHLLWQIAGACIRPNTPWDKVALLYATRGGNGKGTFCQFLRAISGNTASIAINAFDSTFGLEELMSASAVITDENDVGGYLDNLANFKAAVTGDVIQINRKYKAPVSYRFQGFMVQCVNKILKVRDKTGSLARRLLYIPFDKCFVDARTPERKYIKHDYLKRPEVLEYALHKILNMDYDELDIPAACRTTLHEHQLDNNPVLNFAEEILPELKWDLVPFTFLYDLYKAWFKVNSPSGMVQSSRAFMYDLLDILDNTDLGWHCPDKTQRIVSANRMNGPEPLILEYGLENWMNPNYKGHDPSKRCMPELKYAYRGISRKAPDPEPPQDPDEPEDNKNGPNVAQNAPDITPNVVSNTVTPAPENASTGPVETPSPVQNTAGPTKTNQERGPAEAPKEPAEPGGSIPEPPLETKSGPLTEPSVPPAMTEQNSPYPSPHPLE